MVSKLVGSLSEWGYSLSGFKPDGHTLFFCNAVSYFGVTFSSTWPSSRLVVTIVSSSGVFARGYLYILILRGGGCSVPFERREKDKRRRFIVLD